MKKILFVCTGNTCRSSMAEGIFNAAVSADMELSGRIAAISAGVSAVDGCRASDNSVKVLMEEWNIDIDSHRSRAVTDYDVKEAYLILTMTWEHKYAVLAEYPLAESKTFTLKEFVSNRIPGQGIEEYGLDILDPYGRNESVYKACAEEIKNAVDKLLSKLKKDLDS